MEKKPAGKLFKSNWSPNKLITTKKFKWAKGLDEGKVKIFAEYDIKIFKWL